MEIRCECGNPTILLDYEATDQTTMQLLLFCPVCEEHLKAEFDMKALAPDDDTAYPGQYL